MALVEAYAKEQGLWHDPTAEPVFSETVELDLSHGRAVSLAGPARPQDRVPLDRGQGDCFRAVRAPGVGPARARAANATTRRRPSRSRPATRRLDAGSDRRRRRARPATRRRRPPSRATVPPPRPCRSRWPTGERGRRSTTATWSIAAITSCTNTSNPSVMVAAGLLAKKAVERGLRRKPWVKTSLAPGSRVVVDYYERAGLTPYLEKLGFHLVGFGCTTCIGNSGPLPAGDLRGRRRGRPGGGARCCRATATSRAGSTPTCA